VSHTDTGFSTGSGQTDQVFRTNVGGKNGGSDDVPGFALSKQVVFAVRTFLVHFVFFDRTPYGPGDSQYPYDNDDPVDPNKFM